MSQARRDHLYALVLLDSWFAAIDRYRATPGWRWRLRKRRWKDILDIESRLS